jgi:hypothetical protein
MPAKPWKELMNEAEEGAKEFALLDPGMYSFVVKEPAKVGQTGKELPKFTISASVESGPRQNARVWHDFSVSNSPYAMKTYFFGELANLGLGAEFFESNPTDQQIAQALQGKRFVAEIFHEEGNDGKTRAKIKGGTIQPPVSAAPAAGVPAGLSAPAASASNLPSAPPQGVATHENPWGPPAAAAPAPPQFSNTVPLPPAFGGSN